MLNLFSTFNSAYLVQGNAQSAGNAAYGSWGAVQGVGQYAGNGAYIYQKG